MDKLETGALLLVGEGDFSFTTSLQRKIGAAVQVTASTLLSQALVQQTHAGAAVCIKSLIEHGAEVLFQVDATRLSEHADLVGRTFDRIIFNFPHIGGKSKINKNRQLLKEFFCRGQGGTPADLVHPPRVWTDTWQVISMAAEADLVLSKVIPFCVEDYPAYSCTGYRSRDQHFHTDAALTHIFQRSQPLLTPDPVMSLKLQDVDVEGVEYMAPAHLAEKMNRNLLQVDWHPLCLLKQQLLKLLSESCRSRGRLLHVEENIPVGAVTFSEEVSSHSCELRYSLPGKPMHNLTEESSTRFLHLRTSLLDSAQDVSTFRALSADALFCCCGEVFRRTTTETYGPSVKHEMVLLAKECEFSREELLSIVKDVLNTLFRDRRIQLSESDDASSHSKGRLDAEKCTSFELSYHSENVHTLLGCNQVGPTGKASPDVQVIKHARVAQTIGHIGQVFAAPQPTIACILRLDEACMVVHDIPDWRLLWSTDARLGEQFRCVSAGSLHLFRPISLHPPLWRHDVSFWEDGDADFDESRLLGLVQDICGDIVWKVLLMNVWRQPTTGKVSRCYRIVYQSCDRAVSHGQAHDYQKAVRLAVEEELKVAVR